LRAVCVLLFPLSILRSEGAVPRISCSLPPCCCDPQHVIHTHTHTHTHTPGLRRPQQRGRARVISSAAFSSACLTPRVRTAYGRAEWGRKRVVVAVVLLSSHELLVSHASPTGLQRERERERERERVVRSSHEQLAPFRCPRCQPAYVCMPAARRRAMLCASIRHTRVRAHVCLMHTRADMSLCMSGRHPLLAAPRRLSQQLADTTL